MFFHTDEVRIIREHGQWWIMKYRYVPYAGYRWGVVGNAEGGYENALARFYQLLNNYRAIRKKVLEI